MSDLSETQHLGRIDESILLRFVCSTTLDVMAEQQGAIYKFLLYKARRCRGPVMDIAHESLLKAFRNRLKFQGRSVKRFLGWLSAIVRHTTADYFRNYYGRRDRFPFSPALVNYAIDLSRTPEERYLLIALLRAVESEVLASSEILSDLEQDVLRLVGWHEFSPVEVAAELKLDHGSIEDALHRGRTKVRAKLTADGWLEQGERIIKDRVFYSFAPDSGQRRARPHDSDE